jgi:hypothetical protein
MNLGMGFARFFMPALTDDRVILNNHATDPWVRFCRVKSSAGKRDCLVHQITVALR